MAFTDFDLSDVGVVGLLRPVTTSYYISASSATILNIYSGSTQIQSVYSGATTITSVYVGSTKVFG